jgi:hypothetical protein
VNRATAESLADEAFRTAVVPVARLFAEHITRELLARRLGWDDIEFVFDDLDPYDERTEAEIDEILLRNDVLMPDEVRQRRGLPPLPGGIGQLTLSERQSRKSG